MRTVFILIAVALTALAGGALFIYSGVYNVSATAQHTAPVYWLLSVAMRRSVKHHVEEISVPPLTDPALVAHGLRLYRVHCVQCHGAPGVAPEPFALGMMPSPANLALTAREWRNPAEIFWVVKFGIKTSGMPAWEFRLAEADLWAVAAFVRTLPLQSPREYKVRVQEAERGDIVSRAPASAGIASEAEDIERGKVALQQYACVTCHVIPGVVAAINPVGPSLEGIAARRYLAGIVPNTRENMIRWLRSPQAIDPASAMPDLRVTERDAQDIAAFLDTLR
ncbi:MAG: c-type cytochrome [Casimicrobiaceae bacterium]